MYVKGPECYRVREIRRALFWGLGLPPVAGLGGLFVSPFHAWLVQMLRM